MSRRWSHLGLPCGSAKPRELRRKMVEREPGKECCDELHPDDGREGDGEDHKGDWGSHSHADRVAEEPS